MRGFVKCSGKNETMTPSPGLIFFSLYLFPAITSGIVAAGEGAVAVPRTVEYHDFKVRKVVEKLKGVG